MNKYKNTSQLIEAFFNGETAGFAGSTSVLSNTKIVNNQIIHYSTPILERYGESFIFNESLYSVQTKKLQKAIKEKLISFKCVSVNNVCMDFKGL